MKLAHTTLGTVLIGVVALALLVIGIGWYVAPEDKLAKTDAIIVVSGGDNLRRTEEGIRLWQEGWAPRLIFSGAAADGGTSNAAVMRDQARQAGVPEAATLVEERSTNTRENAERVKPLLDQQRGRSAILVSSPYHTRRVKTTFQKVYGGDYRFIAHPAKDTAWSRRSWWRQAGTIALTWDELRKTFFVAFVQH